MTNNEIIESIKSTFDQVDLTSSNFNSLDLFTAFEADDDIKPLRRWAIEKRMKADDFDRAYRYWRVTQTLGEYPETVEDYVRLYVARNLITARFDGLLLAPSNGAVAANPDMAGLERDLRLMRDKVSLPFKDRGIADAVSKWLAGARQARLEAAFASIVSNEPVDADADWITLCEAIADTDKMSAVYVARVLQATVWQVKRKLADDPDFPVHDHLMPILCGPQGSGKTQATMKFFGPIADLIAPTNFAEVTDGRNFDLWSFPVLFIDEMEAADRSDVEAIKNAITRPIKSGRVLYTSSTSTTRVRSTFWGCTNGTLGDKITDTTGLRRFGPIMVKHAPTPANEAAGLPTVGWEAINGLNYHRLWQSVDHRAAHPLRSDPDACAEWASLCEAERQQDSVEVWLRQVKARYITGSASNGAVTTGKLYEVENIGYAAWCKRNGMGVLAMPKFGKRLKSLSSFAWYPFEPPVSSSNGTVHRLKLHMRVAA